MYVILVAPQFYPLFPFCYAKIAEILATHDQLFWPRLYTKTNLLTIMRSKGFRIHPHSPEKSGVSRLTLCDCHTVCSKCVAYYKEKAFLLCRIAFGRRAL